MKKILYTVFLAVVLAFGVSHFAFAQQVNPVSITLNGEPVDCASYGQEATIVEGRTLVPLRAIFEALGASVEWDASTRTVSSTLDEITIKLTIGENALYRNGKKVEIDVPAQIMNGRTMVPARAVAESFGVSVGWSAKKRTVVLMKAADTEVNAFYNELTSNLSEYVKKTFADDEILMTVDSVPVCGSAVRYFVMYVCATYGKESVSDDEVKAAMESFHGQNAALLNIAHELGIEFTQQDYDNIFTNVETLKAMYGKNYGSAFQKSPFTEYFYYLFYSVYSPIFSKVYDVLVTDTGSELSIELSKNAVQKLKDEEYVRAKHILIQFPEGKGKGGELTAEQKSDTLAKANAVLKEVNAMSDISEFDALITKYNQDPGMASNPDGYYFKRGEMVEPFEKCAYSLKEGETSGIVETSYGYHILLRLPLEDDSVFASSAYLNAFRSAVSDYLYELSEEYEYVYADNYDERIEDFVGEYDTMMAQ